jgi:hypothetical protein
MERIDMFDQRFAGCASSIPARSLVYIFALIGAHTGQ